MGQEPRHDLGDEVALGLVADHGLQHDGVGAAVGVEQHVGAVAIVGGEMGSRGRLGHAVQEMAADGRHLDLRRLVTGQDGQQPPRRLDSHALGPARLLQDGTGLRGIGIAHPLAHVQGIGHDCSSTLRAVPPGNV